MCLFYSEQTLTLADSDLDASKIEPFKTPSLPAIKFWGLFTRSGLASNSLNNVDIKRLANTTINIQPEFSTTPSTNFFYKNAEYTWHEKLNNGKWKTLTSSENNNNNILTVKSPPYGVSYYQLEADYNKRKWYFLIPPFKMYSKIIAIHSAKANKPIESINIKTESNYLYNKTNDFDKSSTFATALIDPTDSTEDIHWSIDPQDLASITDNGKIIANTNETSGVVNVWAYVTHPDGTKVASNKIPIRIGGGLDDQTVQVGKNATFKILGLDNTDDKREEFEKTSISWYKKGYKEAISNNEPTFTIQNVKAQADGEKYYAKITTVFTNKSSDNNKKKTITKSLTTNEATLHVIHSDNPNVTISTKLSNTEYHNKNDLDCTLNNVTNGDKVNYEIILNNESNKPITKSTLTIPIHTHSMIQNISLDNNDITSKYLNTDRDSNGDGQGLIINIDKLDKLSTKIINIETTIQNIPERGSSTSTVKFSGIDSNNQKYESSGPGTTINYITNELTYQFHDINFEPIKPLENNTLKYRLAGNNSPNDIISIDDQRRNKKHIKLTLKQTTELLDNKANKLNAALQFYFNKSLKYNNLLQSGPIDIEKTQDNDTFQSIQWDRNEGLLLKTGKGPFKSGFYSAKLTWSFIDSVN